MEPTQYQVSDPTPATVLLVDLRNFTPNLNAADSDDRGVNQFCHFLSHFYSLCLDATLIALPPDCRENAPLYVSSTGDGMLGVVHHPEHVRYGFFASIILNTVLQGICEKYNSSRAASTCPQTSFGIGVECGDVCRIQAFVAPGHAPFVDTYIGECINVAARAESMTKLYDRSNTILAAGINEQLSTLMYGDSYIELIEQAINDSNTDNERLQAQDRMNEINRGLCLTFMHHHNLKGVAQPMPLFRLAHGSVTLGNPRFDSLLKKLAQDEAHLQEVLEFFEKRIHG